ncbi:MAG TPA: integrase core domain-containing protein [Casimicrobiaceae bacterium]|nr:integrase core domain-containing protein [Casimicrobiaceae bacterium]
MKFVLAVKVGAEAFASLCRQFGISRKTGYKWWKRYCGGGVRALEEASRQPRRRPREHGPGWREALRCTRLAHPRWGPKKLRRVLQKGHPKARPVPAVSTLARWLGEMGLVGARRRRARRGPVLPGAPLTVPQAPNEVWTVDFKGWFRTGEGRRCEPLTVRDLHSRFVLAVVLLANQSDASTRRAMRLVFIRYGLPKIIRVDNGAPFGGNGALGLSRLSVWWLRLGIAVEFTRHAHPQDNGAHEQMHRIFKADTAAPPAAGLRAQKRRTRAWVISYNQQRPHEALGQEVPARFYRRSRRRMPGRLSAANYPRRWEVRRVRNRGHIKWKGRLRFVGRAFAGELVGLKAIENGVHEVYLGRRLIGVMHLHDAAGMRPASLQRSH